MYKQDLTLNDPQGLIRCKIQLINIYLSIYLSRSVHIYPSMYRSIYLFLDVVPCVRNGEFVPVMVSYIRQIELFVLNRNT